MTNQSTGANGQPLFDDGYPGDDAVDLNLVSNFAASIIAALNNSQASSSYMDLQSGVSYDSPTGLNNVIALGTLRIVTFSFYSSTAIAAGTNVANMKTGNRPYQTVYAGAALLDGSTNVAGSVYLTPSGSIGVVAISPDIGSDGKFNAVRGQFIYLATS